MLQKLSAVPKGHIHPLSQTISQVNAIFHELGFTTVGGPEIEDTWHNFDALNVPPDHPARDMQDTFLIKNSEKILRTQTSAVQIRYMKKHTPPFRIIVPGETVFRNEATDMTHEAQFYQSEALVVDKGITLGHLKWTLEHVLSKLFEGAATVRLRPGYFPFVEPGVEADVRLTGEHVPEKLKDKWIEIVGSGMVHPEVLRAVNIDPEAWQGYAFAIGIDRATMLKHEIDDVRLSYTGDLRFVNQF